MATTQHEPDMNEEESITETVKKSVTGEDEPMEREHPRAPWELVWYTYPLALVVLLVIAIFILGMFWGGE